MNEEYIKYENKDKKPQYKCVDPLYFLQKRPVLRLDPPKKLNYEMLEAYNVLKPKPEEFSIRAYLVTKMKKLIKSFDKELIVEIFGSYECDLFLHTSDIDIVIYKSHGEVQNSVLNELRKVLDRCDFIDSKSVFHIKRAKIPIIRCNDSVFNMRFDISTEIRGVEQSTFIKSEIAKKPFLKNFALLLKYFIKVRDLADSKRGGLCSYAQFLLLLHFFELHPLVQTKSLDPEKNVGILFMDFFQYFGFDYSAKAKISIVNRRYLQKTNFDIIYSIEDPTNLTHDVGSLCTNADVILELFTHSYRLMSLIMKKRIYDDQSLLSIWLNINKAEEDWRENNIKKWFDLNIDDTTMG